MVYPHIFWYLHNSKLKFSLQFFLCNPSYVNVKIPKSNPPQFFCNLHYGTRWVTKGLTCRQKEYVANLPDPSRFYFPMSLISIPSPSRHPPTHETAPLTPLHATAETLTVPTQLRSSLYTNSHPSSSPRPSYSFKWKLPHSSFIRLTRKFDSSDVIVHPQNFITFSPRLLDDK